MTVVAFLVLAALAVVTSLAAVLTRRIFYGALHLVVSLLAVAGIFIILGAEFLAAVQVIVYAGSVVVLFVFVLMSVGFREVTRERRGPGWWATLVVLGGLIAWQLAAAAVSLGGGGECAGVTPLAPQVILREMGRLLFRDWLVPLELLSLLILAVMIGIAALRREERSR